MAEEKKKGGILREAYKRAMKKVKKFIGASTDEAKDPLGLTNHMGGSSAAGREAAEALAEEYKR